MGKRSFCLTYLDTEVGLGNIENLVHAVMSNVQSLYFMFNVIYNYTILERKF